MTKQAKRHIVDDPTASIAQNLARKGGPTICGDIDIRIGRDGTWFYHGSPIGRKPLVKLFSTVLQRDEHGDYWLITPVEKARITVDDAPFVAVELSATGHGEGQDLAFRTNLDEWVSAGPEHHIRVTVDPVSGEPAPYVHVRGGLEALIGRSVFYELVELGGQAPGSAAFGVWSGGKFFPLGQIEDNS